MSEEIISSTKQSTEKSSGSEIPASAPPSVGWSPARIFFCVLLVSLVTSFGTVYFYDRFVAQKLVAVDLQGFLVEQKEQYLRGAIDDAELKLRMDRLEQFVGSIPKRYAVVLGDVVVGNVEVIEP